MDKERNAISESEPDARDTAGRTVTAEGRWLEFCGVKVRGGSGEDRPERVIDDGSELRGN